MKDITQQLFYQSGMLTTTIFIDIGVPILRNTFPNIDFATAEVPVPEGLAKKLDLDKPTLPLDGLITLGLGVICTLVYWAPAAMEQKFLISNGEIQLFLLFIYINVNSRMKYPFGALTLNFNFAMCIAIAWALGMVSLGAISLGSFQTGAILLAGLFCYDIFWVCDNVWYDNICLYLFMNTHNCFFLTIGVWNRCYDDCCN